MGYCRGVPAKVLSAIFLFYFSSIMKRQILSILLILGLIAPVMGKSRKVVIKIMETTDIHGNFFGYDFKENHPLEGGLPQVASYVRSQRDSLGKENCILVDAGDVLQGQPCVYYTNFIDTKSPHLASEMMNFMGYDAAAFGNHDIEAGHPVFNRWVADCSFPVLGANILSKANGKPYAKPYCIVEREGVKIAILGMITPAIPMWLPEKLWQGLQFEDMVESAKKWVPFILEKEKPDVMVGLFHCGLKSHGQNGYNENPAEEIARNIPGLDILFYGHDHQAYCQQVTNNVSGNNVWLLNAGGETVHAAEAILTCSVDDGNVTDKKIAGKLVSVKGMKPDEAFLERFKNKQEEVQKFVSEEIGTLDKPIYGADYFFGNSTIGDLMHHVQFQQMKANISLVTPLVYDDVVKAGKVAVRDIFTLYQFENMINVFELTGKEVRDALEYSYSRWVNTMKSPDDHALNIRMQEGRKARIAAATFCLMSAAGISYEVDLSQPVGKRVHILKMRDGSPFSLDKTYRVAVNSYVGSGGCGLLTEGTGLSMSELRSRMKETSDHEFRYYIIDFFRSSKGPLQITPLSDWKFVPDSLVKKALESDRKLLFGE